MKSYSRFYGLLKKLSIPTDERVGLIRQFTKGRTLSLREMSEVEYKTMCDALEDTLSGKVNRELEYMNLKKKRSAVLHQMQKMGINTADWEVVNKYCQEPRIAGKVFRDLKAEDLDTLLIKLIMIHRKEINKINETLN